MRRAFILVTGSTLVLVGAVLLVLPGPGVAVMVGGLALLATEFDWARAWLKRVRANVAKLAKGTNKLLRGHV